MPRNRIATRATTALLAAVVVAASALAAAVTAATAAAAPVDAIGVAAASTLSVIRAGTGSGFVFSNVGAINCGATCADAYADGTAVTLVAVPAPGSQFTGWLGPCTGTGNCVMTVNGPATASATFASPAITGSALDIDGNGACEALTDGLLAVRDLLGVTGAGSTAGALATGATRNGTQTASYLAGVRPQLDIDGDGVVDAKTDGLLLLRYLFGLRGSGLVAGAVGAGARRVAAPALEAYLAGLCTPPPAPCLDPPKSNTGCEFFAAPLANTLLDRNTFSFAVVLHNTGTTSAAVTVAGGGLQAPLLASVLPGTPLTVTLPWVGALQTSATVLQAGAAYRITSSLPIAAWQFNPLQSDVAGIGAGTSDASLLLPVAALTGNYRVAAWPSWQSFAGIFAVVGTQDTTQVTVSPSATIVAGGGLSTAGGTVTLNRGDVLQVSMPPGAALAYGQDPSGSSIFATRPIAVFGGHDATAIPAAVGYADHLEEQLPPVETLGADMLVPQLLTQDGSVRRQYVKIVGTQPATQLQYDPPAPGRPTALGTGQTAIFEATASFRLSATAPILVTRFMEGGGQFGDGGDPSMGLIVPTSQFRELYDFHAPIAFPVNRITVVAPSGTKVLLDGAVIPSAAFTAVGSSGYGVADLALSNTGSGAHRVVSAVPVGVHVYGYGQEFTSYLYPGGMNLAR